jgi:hypothetical protein
MSGSRVLADDGSTIGVVSVAGGHGDQRLIRIPSMRPISLRHATLSFRLHPAVSANDQPHGSDGGGLGL